MIQMTATAAFLITMEQNSDARAPSRVIDRSPSWIPRDHLTCFLVLGLMGVHVDLFSKLPHYLYCQCWTIYLSSKALFNGLRAYRIWMTIEVHQRSLVLRFGRRASPARLRDSLGIEARIGRSMETISRWTIVKEWRRRSPHGSD